MRAVEGSLLVVDSTQGVEAQTLANVYHAIDADHEIVPVLNKIDLPASDCDRVAEQIEDVIGIDASEAIRVSAKTGQGIVETLEAIVHKLPAPKGTQDAPLKAMLVDSWYDSYLGVIVLVRIMDGVLKKGERIKMLSNGSTHHVDRIGVFRPAMTVIDELGPGVPSDASDSHGRTFEDLFADAGHDFYKLDPKLFSPAVVVFHNLRSGRTFDFGRRMPELLEVSFGLSGI